MQAVRGYINNGLFEPLDNFIMPIYAKVLVVIEEEKTIDDPERQARIDGVKRIEAMIAMSMDEDLSDFPYSTEPMKTNYDDWGVLD